MRFSPQVHTQRGDQASCLGEMLLVQIFVIYLLVATCLYTRLRVGTAIFPLGIVAGAMLCIRANNIRLWLKTFFVTLLCWLAAIIAGAVITDGSYDGNAYHQEIVAAILRGWYPGGDQLPDIPLSLWSLHYAKGIEMTEAAVASFVGLMEAGKAVNFILGISAAAFVYGFTASEMRPRNRAALWLAAIAVIANPVYLCQSASFYIDYAKYIFTLITIIMLLEIGAAPKKMRNYMLLFVVISLSVATKFNSFFEEGVTIFAAMLWWICHRQWKTAITTGFLAAGAVIFTIAIPAYHPYITNLIENGHPLFPLMGEGSVDIMTGNTPPDYMQYDRFTNFFRSLFTPALPAIDSRTGGFGILMPLLLIISACTIWRGRRIADGLPIYAGLWIIASCFFFEQSWWARYICQLWIFVVMGTVFAGSRRVNYRKAGILMWIMGIAVILNGLTGIARTGGAILRQHAYRSAVTSTLKGRSVRISGLNEAYVRQLEEKDIEAIPVDISDTTSFRLAYYGLTSSPESYPVMHLDSADYVTIIRKLEQLPFDYSENIARTSQE
ncbi:MAG: hypothetical protein K2H98_08390 [Duncaniella sp.]|nr:hypothetical protein [Duncaniella sp.]